MTDPCIFKLKNISKTFRNDKALFFNGTLCIPKAQLTFITGQSGVGKSTLLNQLSLIDLADQKTDDSSEMCFIPEPGQKIDYFELYRKEARWLKRPFTDPCASIRRQYFGFLPQQGHLLNMFSTQENLSLVAFLRNQQKHSPIEHEIHEILSIVGFQGEELQKRVKFSTGQLSGGEAQRIALARTILSYPKVIFVDEPTTFMDEALVEKTMEVLAKAVLLKDCTVIIVTHEYDKLIQLLQQHQFEKTLLINKCTLNRSEASKNTVDISCTSDKLNSEQPR